MVSDFSLKMESIFTRTKRVCKVEDYLLCIKRDVRTQEVYNHWLDVWIEERRYVLPHAVRL